MEDNHFTAQPLSVAWDNGTTVYEETVGIMQTYFVYPESSRQIVSAAEDGDPVAIRLADMMNEAVSRIENAPRYFPFKCICCPKSLQHLDDAGLFFIILPSDPQQRGAWATTCPKCAENYDAVIARIESVGRSIWPSIRKIDASTMVGNA